MKQLRVVLARRGNRGDVGVEEEVRGGSDLGGEFGGGVEAREVGDGGAYGGELVEEVGGDRGVGGGLGLEGGGEVVEGEDVGCYHC